MTGKILSRVAAVLLAASATSAQAEVLPVQGVFPAGSDAAIAVETLSIDNLDGSQGAAQRFALIDDLEKIQVKGAPWFNVVNANADDWQAKIIGSVGHDSLKDELDDKEVKSCLEKDSEGKCLRRRTTFVPCHSLTVRLYPDLVLVDEAGSELLGFTSRMALTKRYCEDDGDIPSTSDMLDALHNDLAWDIRRELAPIGIAREVRILERRKGFEKPDRNTFKDAVRMTKNDVLGACIAFDKLEAANPAQPSLLFNIGVCKEGEGNLDAADDYYARTQAILGEKSYITEAFRRVANYREGEAQLARREGAISRAETAKN